MVFFSRDRKGLIIYTSTLLPVVIPVHGNKDLKKGTFLSILKQAAIDGTEGD